MNFSPLVDVGIVLGAVLAFASFFYSVYKFPGFRNNVKRFLPFLPMVLSLFASRTEDEKGKFDRHDALVLAERTALWMREVISDPENTEFEDVQEELIDFLSRQLQTYKDAGVENVPDLTDDAVKTYVKIVFESIRRVMCEDSEGNDG